MQWESSTNPAGQTIWKCIVLLSILRLVLCQDIPGAQEAAYLECKGPNVTVPYCLQCTHDCTLKCGGPDVKVPWCHPCRDECVTPPGHTRKLLGEDGRAFVVDMWEMGLAEAAPEGKIMSWAANTKWKQTPKMPMSRWAAVCWGVKNDVCDGSLTYQCVNMGL